MKRTLIIIYVLMFSLPAMAQESGCLRSYRRQVSEYSRDIKSSEARFNMYSELAKASRKDYYPKLSGNADYSYKLNPLSLQMDFPGLPAPYSFEGNNDSYGVSMTLSQPIYMGGRIRASEQKAESEMLISGFQESSVSNEVMYAADVYYWNCVAAEEYRKLAEEYLESVRELSEVVENMVNVGYVDRSDLLMVKVKLNDAEYQLMSIANDSEVARMAMNSYAGVPFDEYIPVDSTVIPLASTDLELEDSASVLASHPEMKMAETRITLMEESRKLSVSQYLPQISFAIDGSFSSPGYNLKAGPDPNFGAFVKLTVPICEWGKSRNVSRAGDYSVTEAREQAGKVADRLALDIEKASYTFMQSVQRVGLTENSLQNAIDNEMLAVEKYGEGEISIVEVIDSQVYLLEARKKYVTSKLNAQIAKSRYELAVAKTKN